MSTFMFEPAPRWLTPDRRRCLCCREYTGNVIMAVNDQGDEFGYACCDKTACKEVVMRHLQEDLPRVQPHPRKEPPPPPSRWPVWIRYLIVWVKIWAHSSHRLYEADPVTWTRLNTMNIDTG